MRHNQCRKLMRDKLDAELYKHSLGTAEVAVSLADHYGADAGKAYLAGMIHDYGKRYNRQELIDKASLLGVSLDRITRQQVKLLHAPVGAALIVSELKINDPEIVKAVTYHTTGRSGMTLLEKVLYLADYIEAGRDFEGVEEIRKIAYADLDQALLASVDTAIKSVLARRLLLHPNSVAFRNSLLTKISKR